MNIYAARYRKYYLGQLDMKKLIIIFLVFCFVLSVSFPVCAQEQQAPQEPSKESLKEPLKGKAGAFARIEKAVSTVHAVMSEFRQERRLAMLKERLSQRDVFITKNG